MVGVPSDQLSFLLVHLMSIVVGWAMCKIKNQTVRHSLNLLFGLLFSFIVVGSGILNIVLLSVIVYVAVEVFMPSKDVPTAAAHGRRQTLGTGVFVIVLGYLCYVHIHRLMTEYLIYRIDFSSPLMMAVVKLTTYCWQRVDGDMLLRNSSLSTGNDAKIQDEEVRTKSALKQAPSPLAFLGYMMQYSNVLAGPTVDFVEYQAFIDGSLWTSMGLKELPSTILPSLKVLAYCAMCYPFVMIMDKFPISGYVTTDAFKTDYPSVVLRVLYYFLFVGFTRFKYYFVWYLAEAGCVAQGLGISAYEKATNTVSWNRCNVSRAFAVETCITVKDLIDNWNIRVSLWLKRVVYQRVTLPSFLKGVMSQSSFANLATKLTSAFWHGFYPGYYLFFFHAWLIQTVETFFVKLLLPYFSVENPENPRRPIKIYPIAYIYDLIMHTISIGSLNIMGIPFVVLEFWPSIYVYMDCYFFYYVLAFAIMIITPMMNKKPRKQDKPVECGVEQVSTKSVKSTKDN